MATVKVTEASFASTVRRGTVLLDFWAAWCGPCRAFAPVFEAASARHPDVTFGKIDTESEPALAAAFQIRSIPTLMVLRDGIVLASQPGAMSAAGIDAILEKVRTLDMNAVRRTLDAEERNRTSAHAGKHA